MLLIIEILKIVTATPSTFLKDERPGSQIDEEARNEEPDDQRNDKR
jgi:hypothetical protein